MGVVKTASESNLEETVLPSEEANYSLQGHAGKGAQNFILSFTIKVTRAPARAAPGRNLSEDKCAFSPVSSNTDQGRRGLLSFARSLIRSFIRSLLRSRASGTGIRTARYTALKAMWRAAHTRARLLTGVWRYRYTARGTLVLAVCRHRSTIGKIRSSAP